MVNLNIVKNARLRAIIFSFTLSIFVSDLFAQSQNPYWTLPTNYVNINTGSVSSLPATAISKTDGANGIYNTSGTLDFYLSGNGQVKDRNGNMFYNGDISPVDLSIIPIPGACNSYHLLSIMEILDMDCASYMLGYTDYSFDPTTGTISQVWCCGDLIHRMYDIPFGMAVSTMKVVNSEAQSNLYVVGQICDNNGGFYAAILKYTITNSSGISGETILKQLSSTNFRNVETDLSHDGTLLAWGTVESVGTDATLYVYNISSNTLYSASVTGVNQISGVEFSPANDRIFFTKQGGDIGYAPLSSSGSIGTLSSVSGSSSLGNSQIEYGSDGYMYVSDGSYLKKFDPFASAPTMSGTTITVSNPLNSSYGIYTLVDQIDGGNYSKPFKAYGCTVSKTFNNTAVSSSTVSWFIKTVNTSTVTSGTNVAFTAGGFISLTPGFSAVADMTTTFLGDITACSTSDIDPSCTLKEGYYTINNADTKNLDKVNIYPNPNSGKFTTELKMDISEVIEISLHDIRGNKLKNLEVSEINEVFLDQLPEGIYFIKVTTNNKIYTKKILIN